MESIRWLIVSEAKSWIITRLGIIVTVLRWITRETLYKSGMKPLLWINYKIAFLFIRQPMFSGLE